MSKKQDEITKPDEVAMNWLYFIRNQKVLNDKTLAELYGVDTDQLKGVVERH